MDTFTVRLPQWPVLLRLLGRDPALTTPSLRHSPLGARRVVGSPQQAITRLSGASKPTFDHPPHHGDNNQSST